MEWSGVEWSGVEWGGAEWIGSGLSSQASAALRHGAVAQAQERCGAERPALYSFVINILYLVYSIVYRISYIVYSI